MNPWTTSSKIKETSGLDIAMQHEAHNLGTYISFRIFEETYLCKYLSSLCAKGRTRLS